MAPQRARLLLLLAAGTIGATVGRTVRKVYTAAKPQLRMTSSVQLTAAATAWSFDTACSTGSSTCTTKHVKKHCYNQRLGTAKYASWAIAKAACAANSNCFGVYDAGCRKSSIYLCDSRKITSSAKLSQSGSSCVFENP